MNDPVRLDALDRRIVALLAGDARLTLQQLGDAVGLSAPAVHQRVKKLEGAAVIRGYHADVDPAAVGRELVAFLYIETGREEVERLLDGWRQGGQAEECHRLASGRFLVKVRVGDLAQLERLLAAGFAAGARTTAEVGVRTLFEHRAVAARA